MIHRRALLAGSAALAATAPIFTTPTFAQMAPLAATKAGQVRGATVNGIHCFKGVRYGATTVGRRFMPPVAPEPWTGVRDALDYGNQSPQLGSDRPSVYASWSNAKAESEDCLFLNVFTPGLRDGKKRPVMFWLHGGGFTSGSSSSKYMDGVRLAKRGDIVLVTINHRLNAFGYLYLAHLDPTLADSGNAGMLDIALALRWVRENISEFGGDPNTVMIFGQSGGGSKVSTLMAMPATEGLFHRAVVQSGSSITSAEAKAAEASTARVLQGLGLPVSSEGVARLKAMPQTQFSKAIQDIQGASYGPVLDHRSITRHPFQPDAPDITRNVPMLIGGTKDETASLVGGRNEALFSMTWDQLAANLKGELTGMESTSVITKLRGLYPKAKPSDIYWTATTDYRFKRRAVLQAERKAAQGGAPAFMYNFDWETPVDGGKWKSPHSVEHAFVFDNVAVSSSMIGSGAVQQKLADEVSTAWIKFARSGNPGWAPYTPAKRTTMVFDTVSRVVDDPKKDERLLFAMT